MIKKEITFQDLDGRDVTETYYFGLLPNELIAMDSHFEGGMQAALKSMIATSNAVEVMKILDKMVSQSVGVKDENNRFKRTPEITQDFMGSEAYSALMMELLLDANGCSEFCKGILPAKLAEKVAEAQNVEAAVALKPKLFPGDYTREELEAMPKDEFERHLSRMSGSNIPRELLLLAMRKS